MSPDDLLDTPAYRDDFAVYQRFIRQEDMLEVIATLRHHRIPVRSADTRKGEWRESVIIGNPLEPAYWIEIPADFFPKANYVLQEAAEAEIAEEDIDAHPFATYSVEDLQQVLLDEVSWNPEAVVVARKLLLRSGADVDLASLRQQARSKLAADFVPQKANLLSLVLVSFIGVVAGATLWFLGIMVALGILLYYRLGTRLDPKGTRHWAYVLTTRRQAFWGLAAIAGGCLFGLLNFLYLHWFPLAELDVWLWWWF